VPALTLINGLTDSWALHMTTSALLTAAASHALFAAHPSSAVPSETAAAISAPTARSHKQAGIIQAGLWLSSGLFAPCATVPGLDLLTAAKKRNSPK